MNFLKELRSRMAAIRTAAICTPGDSAPALRAAIEAQSARLAGARRAQTDRSIIPDDLTAYLENLSTQAHVLTDEDIEQLKIHGYSEDAIFEISVCGALGEGLARLERTLDLLEGTAPCD